MRITRFAALGVIGLALVGCKSNSKTIDFEQLDIKDNTSNPVTEGEVPPAVIQAFRSQFPTAQITSIEKRQYQAGNPYYRIHFATEPGAGRTWDYNPGSGR